MIANLVESIQKNLGYEQLHKVDPNIQDVSGEVKSFGIDSIAQAAIPAVLCGLDNFIQSNNASMAVLGGTNSPAKPIPLIFGNKEEELIGKIADYAGSTVQTTDKEVEHIANEAIRLIKQAIPGEDINAARTLLANQHDNFLLYLPASLQIGYLLNKNSLDDRTHKMEGPVSTLMHKIEKTFNSSESN